MSLKNLYLVVFSAVLIISTSANAVIGPIKISLNNEYRTATPVIGSIATTIKLDKEDIKKIGATTFIGLLEIIPSITFEGGPGNMAAVRLRGNESTHTLLLIDGQKVTITGGQPNFKMIPLDQISRIEITKGPFSSLYGPGAIGGVINVFTDKDVNSITGNIIDTSYGSNGTKKTSINSYFNSDKTYLDFTFTDFITDGIDATGDGDLDPSDRQTFGINLGTKISENTSVSLNMIDSKANVMYDNPWPDDKYENDLRQIAIGVSQKVRDKITTNIDIVDQNILRHGSKYELNTISIINEFDFDYSKLSVGIMNSIDKDIGNLKEIKHTDIFTQWQGLIIDNELSIGARVIDHDKFSSHTTYNFNWAKDLSANIRLNASYGSATNLPDHYKVQQNLKNDQTSLKPERSKSFELGISNKSSIGLISVKAYKNKITDAFSYLDPTNNWDGYYINRGIVNIIGAELTLETELMGWNIDTNLDFNKAISKSTNLQKGRRPNRSVSLNLSKSLGKWNRNINWSANSWAWDRDNHSTGKLGGYGLLSLSTSYDFSDSLKVYLNIINALDKDYEMSQGYRTLGKTSTIGLTYTF